MLSDHQCSVQSDYINTFTAKLKKSGYSNAQTHEIVEGGIVGYEKRKERLGTIHRRHEDTATEKEYKKLLGKRNWYKSNKKSQKNTKHKNPQKNNKTQKPQKNRKETHVGRTENPQMEYYLSQEPPMGPWQRD